MKFQSLQESRTFKQINTARPAEVFPLLCPVREKDWVDGWDYTMIHSKSGLIEQDCVFSTPHHGEDPTIWFVSHYNKEKYEIEFVRHSPGEEVVKITIFLTDNGNGSTTTSITYQFTALNENKNTWIRERLDTDFVANMKDWETAINHYLKTGQKFKK